MYFMPLDTTCTGSSPCCRSYPVLVAQSCFGYLVPQTPQTPLHVEQTETSEVITVAKQRERERLDKGSTINTSSVGLLARVVLALYYMHVFHAVRDGMHRELTVLLKLPSPCRTELLRVSSSTNSSNTSSCRANGDL